MAETTDKPVSQIVVTFGGADNLQPSVRAENVSPAQFAIALSMVSLMSQSAWSALLAQAQAGGLVRAPAGAMGPIAAAMARAQNGGRHG